MKTTIRYFLLGIILLISHFANAQHYIAGVIKDGKSKEPIAGASIYLEGTALGTASDKEGKYELTGIPDGAYRLTASISGYQTEEYMLEIYQNKSSVHFRMKESSSDKNATVITGTQTKKKLSRSPILSHVIHKKTIEEQAIGSINHVLENNSSSFENQNIGGSNSYTFGGLDPQYTVFLIDGKRITPETNGLVDLSRINPATIEHIELINGASSVLYGTNAIGGVINIVTRSISKPIEVKAGVQSDLFTNPATNKNGSQEYAYANVNLSKGILSSFTDAKYNNYSPYDLNGNDGILSYLTQEDETNISASQKLILRVNSKLLLSGNVNYYKLDKNIQSQDLQDKKAEDINYGVTASFYPWKKNKLEFSWHNDQNQIYDVFNESTQFKDSIDYDNSYQNAKLHADLRLSHFNRLIIGTEYISEKQSSRINNFEDKSMERFAVYFQDEINITKYWDLFIGGRTEFHSSFGKQFSPQVSTIFAKGKLALRANFGQGFRTPSINELYSNGFKQSGNSSHFLYGNEDLKPETSSNISSSIQYSSEKFDLILKYSLNQIDQLIIATDSFNIDPDTQQLNFVYTNVEEARIHSVNLRAHYQILKKLAFNASYTFTDAINLSQNENLPNIRKHSARANLDFKHAFRKYKLTANFNAAYYGKKQAPNLFSSDQNPVLIDLPDFILLNATTTLTIKKHYIIKVGVNNILDKIELQPRNYNLVSPGRKITIGLAIDF